MSILIVTERLFLFPTDLSLQCLYFKVFNGNVDGDTEVKNNFYKSVKTTGIRILPTVRENAAVALRVELQGCRHQRKYINPTPPQAC